NQAARRTFTATVPEGAALARPYFARASIAEPRYTVRELSQLYRPAAEPVLTAQARYLVAGVPVAIRSTVRRREPHLPYGEELRELMVVPAVAVNVFPRTAIVPVDVGPANRLRQGFGAQEAGPHEIGAGRSNAGPRQDRPVDVRVELANNAEQGSSGQLALQLAAGWSAT